MKDYLIALAIGPVQGFIAAARRTRDLWFGSYVLSEVSKAAARSLHQNNASLIFPAPVTATDLDPESDLDVGNKLVARIESENPARLLSIAKETANHCWREMAKAACQTLDEKAIRADIWKMQVDDVLELYGAWVPLNKGYAEAHSRLERLLSARKATRNFAPAAQSFLEVPGYGLPKSSLDAARESVLTEQLSKVTRRKLGLGRGEQLDCPGLVKRFGGNPEQFPPITRIALESWLRELPNESFDDVREQYKTLVNADLATRVRAERFERLPFDGAMLFPSRIEAQLRELEEDETEAKAALFTLKDARKRLYGKYGEPTPYFAVLAADGDRMGAFIDAQAHADTHIKVTQALAKFAAAAKEIVATHSGACIYAGGDDVLALLPVHTAVACSRALRDQFAESVKQLGNKVPTLSIGLGIGHVLTPFGRLLDLGRRAEKLAKEGMEGEDEAQKRNALAIIVGVRSGAEVAVRGRWLTGIDERLGRWVEHYRADHLSNKTPYELQACVRQMDWARCKSGYREIIACEVSRILKKKRADAKTREISAELHDEIITAVKEYGIDAILAELRVGLWLAQKAKE